MVRKIMTSSKKVVAVTALTQAMVMGSSCPAAFDTEVGADFAGAQDVQAVCQKLLVQYKPKNLEARNELCSMPEFPELSDAVKKHLRERVHAGLKLAFETTHDAGIVLDDDYMVAQVAKDEGCTTRPSCREPLGGYERERCMDDAELSVEFAYRFDKKGFARALDSKDFMGLVYMAFPSEVSMVDARDIINEKLQNEGNVSRMRGLQLTSAEMPLQSASGAHRGCDWFGETVGQALGALDGWARDSRGGLSAPESVGMFAVDFVSNYTPLEFLNEIEEASGSSKRFTCASAGRTCNHAIGTMAERGAMDPMALGGGALVSEAPRISEFDLIGGWCNNWPATPMSQGCECEDEEYKTKDDCVNAGMYFGLPHTKPVWLAEIQNTNQDENTNQDCVSSVSSMEAQPAAATSSAKIINLNVKGKRGNIVQTYPATEYDFHPVTLEVGASDLVHFQW